MIIFVVLLAENRRSARKDGEKSRSRKGKKDWFQRKLVSKTGKSKWHFAFRAPARFALGFSSLFTIGKMRDEALLTIERKKKTREGPHVNGKEARNEDSPGKKGNGSEE